MIRWNSIPHRDRWHSVCIQLTGDDRGPRYAIIGPEGTYGTADTYLDAVALAGRHYRELQAEDYVPECAVWEVHGYGTGALARKVEVYLDM